MSNLIFPRIAVFWGNQNLTAFTGGEFYNEPLVYDVSVDLSMKGANPTGSFKWNPSGKAFTIYEQLLKQAINQIITVRFYYEGAKQIDFDFIWAGEKTVYGNDQTVTILLKSQLDGLINTDIRTTTQTYEEKPATFRAGVSRLQKQFGVGNIVRTTTVAEEDLNKATFESLYRESETFGSALNGIVEANGNYVYANNHSGTNLAIFTPFQREKDVVEPSNAQKSFSSTVRYGYLLGPGIVDSFERTLEWQPPQRGKGSDSRKQQLVTNPKPTAGSANVPSNNSPATNTGNTQQSLNPPAPGGSRSARPNNGIRNSKNPDGPAKQLQLQAESQCKLNANIFVCPALMGIKPNDIVYIPSLQDGAPYIEDWIVENVSYQQTSGGLEVSIGATRIFARAGLMNPGAGAKFQRKAASLNLEGRAGLTAWQKYAWDLPYSP